MCRFTGRARETYCARTRGWPSVLYACTHIHVLSKNRCCCPVEDNRARESGLSREKRGTDAESIVLWIGSININKFSGKKGYRVYALWFVLTHYIVFVFLICVRFSRRVQEWEAEISLYRWWCVYVCNLHVLFNLCLVYSCR